jgi:hypothetical protein
MKDNLERLDFTLAWFTEFFLNLLFREANEIPLEKVA